MIKIGPSILYLGERHRSDKPFVDSDVAVSLARAGQRHRYATPHEIKKRAIGALFIFVRIAGF